MSVPGGLGNPRAVFDGGDDKTDKKPKPLEFSRSAAIGIIILIIFIFMALACFVAYFLRWLIFKLPGKL
jgi:hypothetical protein